MLAENQNIRIRVKMAGHHLTGVSVEKWNPSIVHLN
jgi:hypothetical protein